MYVLTPELDEAGVEEATARVSTMLTNRGGEITNVDSWGRRRLAYPIENHLEGVYSLVRLKLDPTSIAAIERDFRLNESVIRHLLIRPVA
jgi:small subunit ribosomal protein S6